MKQKTEPAVVKAPIIDDKTQIKEEEKQIIKDTANNQDAEKTSPQIINDSLQKDVSTKKNVEKTVDDNDNASKKTEVAAKKPDPKETKNEKVVESKVNASNVQKQSTTEKSEDTAEKEKSKTKAETTKEKSEDVPSPETPAESKDKEEDKEGAKGEEGDANKRVFDARIEQHEQFNSPQKWYIDVKTDSIAPSYCTNCDATINLGDIHLYSYGLLLLPSLEKVRSEGEIIPKNPVHFLGKKSQIIPKGRDIFKSGYPVGGFFKGSVIFSGKFKGYENFPKNCKGYENFAENCKGYENFPKICKGYEIF